MPSTTPEWLWPLLAGLIGLVAAASGWLAWGCGGHGASASVIGRKWFWLTSIGTPVIAMGLYALLGHPLAADPQRRVPFSAEQTMVDKLADRLAHEPDQPEGWLMLGRSYKVLGKYQQADEAYARAQPLVHTRVDDLVDWIAVRTDMADGVFDEQSARLLDMARKLDAQHEGVQMQTALYQMAQGQYGPAAKTLALLQAHYPADSPDHEALERAKAELLAGRDPRRRRAQSDPPATQPSPSR